MSWPALHGPGDSSNTQNLFNLCPSHLRWLHAPVHGASQSSPLFSSSFIAKTSCCLPLTYFWAASCMLTWCHLSFPLCNNSISSSHACPLSSPFSLKQPEGTGKGACPSLAPAMLGVNSWAQTLSHPQPACLSPPF